VNLRQVLSSRFFKDSAILQFSGGVTALLQLTSTIALANLLGEVEQGTYFLALALYGLVFMLLNTGVMQAAVTQIAASAAKGQGDRVAAWLAFLIKLYGLVGLLLLGIGGLVFPLLGHHLLDDQRIGDLAWWLALTPLLELPRVVAQATFQAARRMRDLATLDLGTEAARVAAVILGAQATGDAFGPIVGTVVAAGVGSLLAIHLYRRAAVGEGHKLPGIRLILGRVRDVPVREGLHLGLRIGFLRSLDALAFNILPPLFIQGAGALAGRDPELTKAVVAHFRIAQRLMQIPVLLLQGISRTTLPALSQMAGRRDAEGFRRAFLRVTLASGLLSMVSMATIYLVLPHLQPLFRLVHMPDDYWAPLVQIASVLALGYGLLGFTVAFDSFYIVTNRLRVAIVLSAAAMAIGIPTLFALCYYLLETGAAWGVVTNFFWLFVHLVYIGWFFRGRRHLEVLRPTTPQS
jgi:O-antigen/teichoic acid export membrane protein